MNLRHCYPWLRTVQGQLSLLSLSFLGALGLSIAALSVRSCVFERFVHEDFPTLPTSAEPLREDMASSEVEPSRIAGLSLAEIHALYGVSIESPDSDPRERLFRSLMTAHPRITLDCLRRTLSVGSMRQRARATRLLGMAADTAHREEALFLCRHALASSVRMRENRWEAEARQSLAHLVESGSTEGRYAE